MSALLRGLPHCAVRARQRYGIALSLQDVRKLARRCRSGEGRTETKPDGVSYHGLIHTERLLWIVYRSPAAGSPHRHGTVITIMPPGVGAYRAHRDHAHMQRRKGCYDRRRR
jgi:hypothetical protein